MSGYSGSRMNMSQMNGHRRPPSTISNNMVHQQHHHVATTGRPSTLDRQHQQPNQPPSTLHSTLASQQQHYPNLLLGSSSLGAIPQHDELIKYVQDSWNRVYHEADRSSATVMFYQEHGITALLKDFEPFNLDEFCKGYGVCGADAVQQRRPVHISVAQHQSQS